MINIRVDNKKIVLIFVIVGLVMLSGCIDTTDSDKQGSVSLYMSDQPAAIEDFESLNVTVTEVGFSESDGDTNTTEINATVEDEEEFMTYEVDNKVVDLTTVVGDNATQISKFEVPNATYDRVYVGISDVNATLQNGEKVNVKLPSDKLQINQEFTVGDGEEVSFVYDIHVVKAGNSGKYILRPVVSESGADQEFNEVDENGVDIAQDDETDEADRRDTEDEANNESGNETVVPET